jgi:hypothetical protein
VIGEQGGREILVQLCLYQALKNIHNDDTLNIDNYATFDEMCEAFNDMYNIDVEWKLEDDVMAKWKEKEVSKLKEDITKLKEEEKEMKLKEKELLDGYGGNKEWDKDLIEAVKNYLDKKLKEMYDAEKRENNQYEKQLADLSVSSKVARKYVFYKIVHTLHPTRRLHKFKAKIKDSYKEGKISKQQYEQLEKDISSVCKERYDEKINLLKNISDASARNASISKVRNEIADAYAKDG